MDSNHLENLFSDLLKLQQQSSNTLPPVHLWNPPLSGDMDIFIDRQVRWIHEGSEIRRAALVKLFASILVREENQYFLVTPVEKWRIQVALAPLFVVSATRQIRNAMQAITLTTSTGDVVLLDKTHPLFMYFGAESFKSLDNRDSSAELAHADQGIPMVIVRDNIPALVGRNVYYELIDWALDNNPDNNPDSSIDNRKDEANESAEEGLESQGVYLASMGERFYLGQT